MNQFARISLGAVCAWLLLLGGAHAQVYKCKDANGKMVYSDAPCASQQSGGLIQRKSTDYEKYQERVQAAEANARKYREQAAERQREYAEQQSYPDTSGASGRAGQAATQDCQKAKQELQFASSIRTGTTTEKRTRVNAAIAQVNAACGSNTELIQDKRSSRSRDEATDESKDRRIRITSCSNGTCFDDQGKLYVQNGDSLYGRGVTCTGSGSSWNCR